MNNKRKRRYKSRGSILVITALAAVVWIFIAQSLFIVGAGGFGMIKSSRVALQAQQYAEIAVDRLKNIDYDNLDSEGAHSRQAIANIQESGWEDEVIIGTEHAINGSDDAKQRIATINIYKSGDTLSRFTLEVPLSSQGSSMSKNIIIGTASNGQYLPIPSNWDKSKTRAFVSLNTIHHEHKDSEFTTFCYVTSDFRVVAYSHVWDGGGIRSETVNYILVRG